MSSTGPRTSDGSPYTVLEEPLGTPQHLRVVMIGGGASGLNVARHMKLQMANYELQIYEKNEDVGGTWFENRYERIGVSLGYNHLIGFCGRYPGCACDIPSHNYQYTWEPNPDWSHL